MTSPFTHHPVPGHTYTLCDAETGEELCEAPPMMVATTTTTDRRGNEHLGGAFYVWWDPDNEHHLKTYRLAGMHHLDPRWRQVTIKETS